ncbi:transposase [Streptomyces sp. WG7]|uniref:transposase n=1 Tax=Streptomyces sp. WG7 TaxID=3417650 RepID=UPI003CF902CF
MAEELGVHHEALRGWIRQAEADAGERGDLLTTEEKEELARLRREAHGPVPLPTPPLSATAGPPAPTATDVALPSTRSLTNHR